MYGVAVLRSIYRVVARPSPALQIGSIKIAHVP